MNTIEEEYSAVGLGYNQYPTNNNITQSNQNTSVAPSQNQSNIGQFIILAIAGSFSLFMLFLWIRLLYNLGSPKK